MLPTITPEFTLEKNYANFLSELRNTAFSGEIHTDYASRLTAATDNSIYQTIPQAVIFPKSTHDVAMVLTLAHQEKYWGITFCPRGGGTSTNGQSLSMGIIIDCSKHMRDILELNLNEKWVRVQPGVILDQLNAHLSPHGVCFAPEISPSNRATIGGMVNTDASGVGSKLLGRTSDHVINLTCVLPDGKLVRTDLPDPVEQQIKKWIEPHQTLIAEKFTDAPRTLNGYNLQKAYSHGLNYLICGSEGTLAVVTECTLKLTPIPKYKKLIVVKYHQFTDALQKQNLSDTMQPLIIEAIDEKLIELARHDPMYFYIKEFIDDTVQAGAVNLVEFVAADEAELEKTVTQYCQHLENNSLVTGYYLAKNPREEKLLWDLRKKSVGLISKKITGTRRPIPFIEDTAVPPEKLADYIKEFKSLLDSHQLTYGMYGHVDAGCIHVRPALDMKLTEDEALMKKLSDSVVALVEKFGGILWGEHGQGHRCVYGERFFGETLYALVRQIKTLFDPHNQLNPGKIALPMHSQQKLVSLTEPLRGQFDKQIPASVREEYATAIACNGNGACFNYASAEIMCPSYKVSKNRIQSPKGRAAVMREWLRQLAIKNFKLQNRSANFFKNIFKQRAKQSDFSHEVYDAMSGCLSCKACASQCPLNVDVPEFKSKFLFHYHTRYQRPLRDYFIALLENIAPLQAAFSRISNWLLQRNVVNYFFEKIKLIDLPKVATLSVKNELKKRRAPIFNLHELKKLSSEQKQKSVIILQDAFTSFYQPAVLLACYDFLTKLGWTVYVAPYFPSGKPLHVKGFLNRFVATVNKNLRFLNELKNCDMPLIGLDPSITLTYRDEYQKTAGGETIKVYLLQEWLSQHQDAIKPQSTTQANKQYYLLPHCTEKSLCVEAEKQWQTIFAAMGYNLIPLAAGCCGMAGSYGHEAEHKSNSQDLFKMDWQRHLQQDAHTILATGYSCRSQANRFMKVTLRHPIEILAEETI